MPPPKTTVWELEPHTLGKHLVLREYLHAWLPILGKWNGRILFIDAFAGPGEYKNGEEGSPVIALNALIKHQARHAINAEVIFLFIEEDQARTEHLRKIVDNIQKTLPSNAKARVINGTFDETMTEVLDYIDGEKKVLAPNFIMIDPFGVKGIPMSVIRRIMRNPQSEVYISFMYESINRFKDTKDFENSLDELFGCETWRDGIDIEDAAERKEFFFNLYKNELMKAGCKFVLSFDLHEGKRHIYTIFFGTQHLKGCDKMKYAIWKIVPQGDFRFVGTHSSQLVLDINKPDFEPLKTALHNEFITQGFVSIEEVTDYVVSDKTDYHSGHVKKALKQMEKSHDIEVDDETRKKKGTYPPGTSLRFKEKNES